MNAPTQAAIGGVLVGASTVGGAVAVTSEHPGALVLVLVVGAFVGGFEMVSRVGR